MSVAAEVEAAVETAVPAARGARMVVGIVAGLLVAVALGFVVWWVFIHPGQQRQAIAQSKADTTMAGAGQAAATGALQVQVLHDKEIHTIETITTKGENDVHPRPAPMLRALMLLAPCTMLCACLPPINLSQAAPPCVALVEAAGLLEPTVGAALLTNDSVGEIAAFGVRQTGQLDKSNADKAGAKRMLVTCDQLWRDGLKKAQPRRRVLGIF